jgi:hypothetical protein
MYWRCVYVAVRSAVLACVLCGAAEMAGDAVGRTERMAQCRSEAGLELGNSENVVARPGFREPPSACGSFYQLEQVVIGGTGGPGHADLAGAVDRRVRAERPPADGGGLAAGGTRGEFGVQQAPVTGEAAALPVVGDHHLVGDRRRESLRGSKTVRKRLTCRFICDVGRAAGNIAGL